MLLLLFLVLLVLLLLLLWLGLLGFFFCSFLHKLSVEEVTVFSTLSYFKLFVKFFLQTIHI